jgi:hypothetical protein
MARNGVQYSDVQQAIDTLLAQGDSPSVQRIREVLGQKRHRGPNNGLRVYW